MERVKVAQSNEVEHLDTMSYAKFVEACSVNVANEVTLSTYSY
jgi:hypothetical protein